MNYFFYVEDSRSGREMFEFLIRITLKKHTRVRNISSVAQNNYVIESGFGYPSMIGTRLASPAKNRLGLTIDEINRSGRIDCLVLCLDTDGERESKTAATEQSIREYHSKLCCPHRVFVQNICVETWLLGIDALFPGVYNKYFEPYVNHYNVKRKDPELMVKPPGYARTNSIYHYEYLKEMARQSAVFISKSSCKALLTKRFMNSLLHRADNSDHLRSLAGFIEFLRRCR